MSTTRERVLSLRAGGFSARQIAEALGLTKSTVASPLRRAGVAPDQRFNRRYDWAEIQAYYDLGHSITECQHRFGFSRESWNAARLRGDVESRPQAMSLAQLLPKPRRRGHLKLRLIAAGLLVTHCYECGIDEWRGRPPARGLHPGNGDGRGKRQGKHT